MDKDQRPIDIEKIIIDIKRDLASKYSQDEILAFEAVSPDESFVRLDTACCYDELYCEDRLISCRSNKDIEWYRPLEGGAMSVFVKKIIRKLSKFLIAPIVEDQTRMNNDLVEVINQLVLLCAKQEKAIAELKAHANGK